MPVAIHGVDYATVNERLALAHGENGRPKGIQEIDTDFYQLGSAILCRARVRFTDERVFYGHSEVPIGSTQPAEKDAPYECAETSAVGRALANAGYPGNDKGLAGAEEMHLAQRRSRGREAPRPTPAPADEDTFAGFDAGPEAPRPTPAPTRSDGPPATAKQLETIANMARRAGKTIATEGLTRAKASEIISSLFDSGH